MVGKKNVRRPVGKRFEERYTILTMKHPPSQIIWWAFSRYGTASLYFLPPGNTLNCFRYVDLLKEKLKMRMNIYQSIVCMLDGASCHCSKVEKQFFSEKNVATLCWSGNNLDLNSIENLSEILKNKIAEKQPSSAGALNHAIKEDWEKEISKDYCEKLI